VKNMAENTGDFKPDFKKAQELAEEHIKTVKEYKTPHSPHQVPIL
jgi:hypothetical protein